MKHFRPHHFSQLKHLAVFALVVDAQSFTNAAKRLGLAKSAVSRYVKELEEQVGVALLRRTTRKLVLTDAGERLYVDCARLVESAIDSLDAVQPDRLLEGSLHIAAPAAFGRRVVLPAIQTFKEEHSSVDVRMSVSDRFEDLVTQGVDVSFRIGSPGHAPAYVFRKIASMRYYLHATRATIAGYNLTKPSRLEAAPWILNSLGPAPASWTLVRGSRTVELEVKPAFVTDSIDVGMEAAGRGMGVIGLPDFMRDDAAALELVELFPTYSVQPAIPVFAVYPRRRFVSPRVAAFLDHVGVQVASALGTDRGLTHGDKATLG